MEAETSSETLQCDGAMSEVQFSRFSFVSIATNTSSSTLKNQLVSPLFRLPAEIRNKIYTYVSFSVSIIVQKIYNMHTYGFIFFLWVARLY